MPVCLPPCLPATCLLLQSYQEGTGEQNDAYRSLAAADEQAAGAVDQRTEKLRGMQQDLSWDNAAQQYEEVFVAAKYQW